MDQPAAPTRIRYLVLFALCLAATLAYVDRGCLSVAETTIRAELGLDQDQTGWLLAGFGLTYALFQLPTGWLGHRWGTRRALPCFAALWSVATGLGALASGFPGLLVSRLGMGAAESGVFPCAASTLGRWFPRTQRAWTCGLMASFMGIGGAIGAAATGQLLELCSWRWVFVAYALPGLLWSAWFYFWFRDQPRQHPAVNAAEVDLIQGTDSATATPELQPPATPWKAIFTSLPLFWLCAQQFFRAAGQALYQTWFPTLLQESRGISVANAGLLTSLPHWAMMAGAVSGGLFSDWLLMRTGNRWLSRQGLAVACLVACSGLMVLAYPVTATSLFILLISVSAFVASFGGPTAYAACIDLGGRHVAPVFSLMNMTGNVGGMLFPVLVPKLVQGQPQNWGLVVLGVAGLHLAAAACWLLFNARHAIDDLPTAPSSTSEQGIALATAAR